MTKFSYSDSVAGYVTAFDGGSGVCKVTTSDGSPLEFKLTSSTYACMVRNLGDGYADCTGRIRELLKPGQLVYVYGIVFPGENPGLLEAKSMIFPGAAPEQYRHEEPDWWVNQIRNIANTYIRWQFNYPGEPIDYAKYRTILHINGQKKGDGIQEIDTISRMVYGMASAYMLTGEEQFLEAAEKGTDYLRDHAREIDKKRNVTYWHHALDVSGKKMKKILTSQFGDDYGCIPCYEQIYALAGPVQTFRLTGDPRILADVEGTLRLFETCFKDPVKGGYYSHLDPATFDGKSPALDKSNNRARKNWNSVGDHAPAYLINLWLATGSKAHADFLEYTFDTITRYFQDYEHSPFVQEKFFDDWSHDKSWGWQQNRAVVGHNLKIAWNLMRMNSLKRKPGYEAFARKIAELMPKVGMDIQRGGWYDVVERELGPGETQHRFVWHDRKAWWQQEQGILAYMILAGVMKKDEYRKLARESAAFYNAWFLDHEDGSVYFNVLGNGLPYLLGHERWKGSHSMSAYHSTELCFLSAVYTNLLTTGKPLDLYFKPRPDADRTLRVSPDILPAGSVKITACTVNGKAWTRYDADKLTVQLPDSKKSAKVKVTLTPQA